jgi:hypothetical protein
VAVVGLVALALQTVGSRSEVVLGNGASPLGLLQKQVDAWISRASVGRPQ